MIQDDVSSELREYWHKRRSVPGAMYDIDFLIFDEMLRMQEESSELGDLLEIGAYLGRSAIVIGAHVRETERLVVCDIFENAPQGDASNERESEESYRGLLREQFETNYRRFLQNDMVIVQESSENICAHVRDQSVRFAHIDGSHLHSVVKQDIANAERYLKFDGVIAFDDYRSNHTPGVAAAIWEQVAANGLVPICVSNAKLYATWSAEAAKSATERISTWLARYPYIESGIQSISGRTIVVVANPKIWTWQGRLKSLIPPVLMERIQRTPKAYLGE